MRLRGSTPRTSLLRHLIKGPHINLRTLASGPHPETLAVKPRKMNVLATKPSPRDMPILPPWTWSDLEEMLLELAPTPTHRLMVEHLVEGLRKSAPFLTPPGVLRELSIITLALTDPSLPVSPSMEGVVT
jgi:hypothetical protein